MEALFMLLLTAMPFGIGWTLFVYLSRKEASMRWQLYTVSRGVVFAFLLMPTFFVAGHGGLPTNTIAGLAATLIFGRPEIGVGRLTFGVAGGPLVYLVSMNKKNGIKHHNLANTTQVIT